MKIVAFAGSLRKGSFNKSLLRAAKEVSPDEMKIEISDLDGIPLFYADVEAQGDPKRVKFLKSFLVSFADWVKKFQ